MAESGKLPYILALLDDESPVVRDEVGRALAAFGPELDAALDALSVPPDTAQRAAIRSIVAEAGRARLKELWTSGGGEIPPGGWYAVEGEMARLETALTLISDFQNGANYPVSLPALLDGLAEEYRESRTPGNPERGAVAAQRRNRPRPPEEAFDLAKFLFQTKGLEGDRTDYYNPINSNLTYVIQARRGLPISLACVYMLVGSRLGLSISGCNWPGHFLARTVVDGRLYVIDCFNGGEWIDDESFLNMQGPSRQAARRALETEADAETIVARVLNNLVRAYEQIGHPANRQVMLDLLKDLERHQQAGHQT